MIVLSGLLALLLAAAATSAADANTTENSFVPHKFRNDIASVDIYSLVERARDVLEGNFVSADGHHQAHTVPSRTLYPNQWFWDACFIAIGVSRYNSTRAISELQAVLEGQWKDGMIPHIVFDKQFTHYFPNWQFWETNVTGSPTPDPPTSGITQPPVLGMALRAMMRKCRLGIC
eukprot:TRINITY_DN6061_c0_g1_i1.p1 TRINITY_DN6061_c0_g1~~TRINITY_DN6061_c0_g1_i1.p1  ORF type:complete len:175 (-),score=17.34 TRINITY_DN6061_c0_g1_i1:367-891(-)